MDICEKNYLQSLYLVQHQLQSISKYVHASDFRIIYLTKMADEEFQILVSTSDFLLMQSKCQDLEILVKKLNEQKGKLDNQLFQLTQKNIQMQKKIIKLEDNIVYLSRQGFKMAQKLIDKDISGEKFEGVIRIQAEKQRKVLLERIKSCQQKIKQISEADELLMKQKKELDQTNNKLNGTIERMKKQLDHLNTRYVEENGKVTKLQNLVRQKMEENQKIKQNKSFSQQFINQQLKDKQALEIELNQRQKQILDYQDRVKGQDLEIKNLQNEIGKLKLDKQVKSMKKDVALKQIQTLIEDYFTMYMLGLIESGGLSKQQISQIIQSQQEVIVRFVKDSIKKTINLQYKPLKQ